MTFEKRLRVLGVVIFAMLVNISACGKKPAAPITQEEEPGETEAQIATAKEQSRANLATIAEAYLAAEKSLGYMPIGMIDPNTGQLGLSWRVQILPYLNDPSAKELYKEFKLDEAWDSEYNKPLLGRMPNVFAPVRGKAAQGYTFYRGFSPSAGGDAKKRTPHSIERLPSWMLSFVFPESDALYSVPKPKDKNTGKPIMIDWKDGIPLRSHTIQSIIDGSSTVVLAAEAREAVPWTKPEEIPVSFSEIPVPMSPDKSRIKVSKIPALGGLFDGDFHFVTIQGAVHLVKKEFHRLQLGGFITVDDGEPPDFEGLGLPVPQWVKDFKSEKTEKPELLKTPKVEPGPSDKDK